jgi:5-methylthioribose kinase
MQLIDVQNAEAYLLERNLLTPNEQVTIRELPGGVSNVVLYVTRPNETDFVLKQARKQLRVAAPWFCSVERVWREVETMKVCTELLTDSSTRPPILTSTPGILFSDSDNFLYGMSAVANHETWKQPLLRGDVDHNVARSCGWLMGRLHGGTWSGKTLPNALHDRQFFDDLRVDPYYREIARVDSELAPAIDRLIKSLDDSICCLVHGDFSPKNLLVNEDGLVLIDFEVGHFGDPAFDIGFFLSHLALKAIRAADDFAKYVSLIDVFREAYAAEFCRLVSADELQAVNERAATNLTACVLARIIGKSQVDYLSEQQRTHVRGIASNMLLASTISLDEVIQQICSTRL